MLKFINGNNVTNTDLALLFDPSSEGGQLYVVEPDGESIIGKFTSASFVSDSFKWESDVKSYIGKKIEPTSFSTVIVLPDAAHEITRIVDANRRLY